MSHKILLVEDDAAIREWLSYELEGEGYRVSQAADGPTGLKQARRKPDLILLDVQLPGMTGFTVGQTLNSNPHTADIPIIFLTALNTSQDKIKGLNSGGVNYITKPFKIAELKANIQSLLNHTQTVRQNSVAAIEALLDEAADVQRHLIPAKLPACPTLDLYADYRAAAQVGGDFYDFMERSDGQLVFAIADVSGKGLPAALLMTSIRTALRNAARHLPGPQAVLTQVNAELYQDLTDVSKLATIFVGFYHPQSRLLTYANTGHAPVIFCPAEKAAEILIPDGPPLGVFPYTLSADHTLLLNPEELLILCSDGFSEVEDPDGEMFGYDRLLEAVNGLAHYPADKIGSQLFKHVDNFAASGSQQDDQTLVVLKGL